MLFKDKEQVRGFRFRPDRRWAAVLARVALAMGLATHIIYADKAELVT
jgi:hypothetical protein